MGASYLVIYHMLNFTAYQINQSHEYSDAVSFRYAGATQPTNRKLASRSSAGIVTLVGEELHLIILQGFTKVRSVPPDWLVDIKVHKPVGQRPVLTFIRP